MKPAAREAFFKWYSQQEGKTFDFMKELFDYCRDDISILEEACMSFRRHIVNLTKKEIVTDIGETKIVAVDPFRCNTIAAVCMAIFRYMFLEEYHQLHLSDGREITAVLQNGKWKVAPDVDGIHEDLSSVQIETSKFLFSPIARMPSGGFAYRDTYSQIAIQWLTFESFKTNLNIQHALCPEGEFKVLSHKSGRGYYKVDGYCLETNTIMEMYGRIEHGCPKCFIYDDPEWTVDSVGDP